MAINLQNVRWRTCGIWYLVKINEDLVSFQSLIKGNITLIQKMLILQDSYVLSLKKMQESFKIYIFSKIFDRIEFSIQMYSWN